MKTYPKKEKKAFVPRFTEEGTYNPEYLAKKSNKVNEANFMSEEEISKSKYANMSNDDFADEREQDKRNCKSF